MKPFRRHHFLMATIFICESFFSYIKASKILAYIYSCRQASLKIHLYSQLLAAVDKFCTTSQPWKTKACYIQSDTFTLSKRESNIVAQACLMPRANWLFKASICYWRLWMATLCPSQCWVSTSFPMTTEAEAGQWHLQGILQYLQ